MKSFFITVIACILRALLWFRYRIEIKGLDKLDPHNLPKKGGVLFLPNHPAVFIDPIIIGQAILKRFPVRPLVIEYMYYNPLFNWMMRLVDSLPIPNFHSSNNSLKRKRNDQVMQTVVNGLNNGENFLIYPAGRVKHTAHELIGGSSGVHRIISESPHANVVLIRIKGLWGSSFSQAIKGRNPSVSEVFTESVKVLLKNLLFFTPRRKIIIEFELAPKDFPSTGSRVEMNRYLEQWYNTPDGLTSQEGEYPGDSLVLVSYSMWSNQIPKIEEKKHLDDESLTIENVPKAIQDKITSKLSEITGTPSSQIKPSMSLASDLGLDSLDISEMIAYLNDQFDVSDVPVNELTTVSKLMRLAVKQATYKVEHQEEAVTNLKKWFVPIKPQPAQIFDGQTMPEVFFNSCNSLKNRAACADERTGVLTYKQMKLRVLILAEHFRHMPGKYIGILLPASAMTNIVIVACQVAGKVPIMINWTIGSRHLESVVKQSNVQVVLSSWAFLDRLDNVELNGIEDMLIMLEEMRRDITVFDKLKALWRLRLSTASLVEIFHLDKLAKDSHAVLLFTSGTESLPKGVPLTHENILTNQRASLEALQLQTDGILLGMLPPFHAFGFTCTSFMGVFSGIRTVFYPNPTDGKNLARMAEKWGVTILCGTPTFLRGIVKAAEPEQLKTVRLCATGAEKAPQELFQLFSAFSNVRVVEGYGITECSPVLTFNRPTKETKGVGEAIPGVELLVVHPENYQILNVNEQGLILARGPNIFQGYLNGTGTSPFMEIEGKQWYKTGDLGTIDAYGRLTIGGRMKRFIKMGGEMISLTSIEDAFLEIAHDKSWVKSTIEGPLLAVCAQESTGEKPKIFLFTRFDVSNDEANVSLKESGFSNLIKIAATFRLDEIPLLGTGKINYRELEAQYLKGSM